MDIARVLRSNSRPGTRPGASAVFFSLGLHALLALAAWYVIRHEPSVPRADFRVYRVSIVSPPPQAYGPPSSAPPVSHPTSKAPPAVKSAAPHASSAVKVAPLPVRKKTPAPARKTKTKKAAAPKPRTAEATRRGKASAAPPARGWKPHPDAAVGGSGINVRLRGEAFPYPGYLENIILQISRFFRWTGSSDLRAEAYFVIDRDGSLSDIQVTRSSGSLQFDLTVRGAIEAAGRRRAFGPLPKGFQGDRLPISFYFQPPR